MPLLLLGVVSLLFGLAAGLVRLGWTVGPVPAAAIPQHGALMAVAFLGTLIGLERAVASRRNWAYFAPLATGLGGLMLVASDGHAAARATLACGALALTGVVTFGFPGRREPWRVVQAIGAAALAAGTSLWAAGLATPQVLPFWEAFVLLTIAGERLELSRVLEPPPAAWRGFAGLTALLVVALCVTWIAPSLAVRLAGFSWLGFAVWLSHYDMARRSLRRPGLPRFMAVNLLCGYFWLACSGVLGIAFGALTSGPLYDALVHSFFLGFVFAMIFAHAPVIFPALLERPIAYRSRFYAHVLLLQLTLALRVASDLAGWTVGRRVSGLLNAVAILIFFVQTGLALRAAARVQIPKSQDSPL